MADPRAIHRWGFLAVACICIVAGLFSAPASAQMKTADPARGVTLAQRLCSGCHVVTPGSGATVNSDVPSFASIAGRADATAERLAGRIIVPHPAMPDTGLTAAELRDIIAYILTLKPARPQ